MGQGSLAVICVECKKSVEQSFGANKTLIIHKMLAGLLGCGTYGKGMLWFDHILTMVYIYILTKAYSLCHIVVA